MGEKKAPAGMGTPQHPGFKEKVIFWAKKKPLREWGHRNTLVLGPLYALGPLYWQCPEILAYQIISTPDYSHTRNISIPDLLAYQIY